MSAYPGWDADAGVFRLDRSLWDLEERYRKIADEANDEGAPPGDPSAAESAPPAQAARG